MRSNVIMLIICLVLGGVNTAIGINTLDSFSLSLGVLLLLMSTVYTFFIYKDI